MINLLALLAQRVGASTACQAKGLSWEKAMIEWDSDYDYVVEKWKERVR